MIPRVILAVLLAAMAMSARGATYYVATDGKPEGDGSSAQPWPSVEHALSKVGGGHTIVVKPGLDWDKLQDAWRFVQGFGGANSLLVIRNGWIAAEWDALKGPIAIHSCTKALTALAMAKLFDLSDAGELSKTIGPDSFAYPYLPASWGDSDPRRKLIRIRHLMTMSSGLYPWDGGSNTEGIPRWDFHLTRPVVAAPETVWAYNSLGVDLLSLIVENVSGQTLHNFFNEKINAANRRFAAAEPQRWLQEESI